MPPSFFKCKKLQPNKSNPFLIMFANSDAQQTTGHENIVVMS